MRPGQLCNRDESPDNTVIIYSANFVSRASLNFPINMAATLRRHGRSKQIPVRRKRVFPSQRLRLFTGCGPQAYRRDLPPISKQVTTVNVVYLQLNYPSWVFHSVSCRVMRIVLRSTQILGR